MSIDEIMALADEYVSASIEDHGYRSGAASAEYLEDTKRKLLAAIESLIAAPAAPQQAEPVTVLPDGSAFFTASMPLPDDHWIFAPRGEWDNDRDCCAEIPLPILTHAQRDAVMAAIRYAVRGATDCGAAMDFDPDALVQNAVYALCGPFSEPKPQQAEPVAWRTAEKYSPDVGSWFDYYDEFATVNDKTGLQPLYLHPPTAEVQRLQSLVDRLDESNVRLRGAMHAAIEDHDEHRPLTAAIEAMRTTLLERPDDGAVQRLRAALECIEKCTTDQLNRVIARRALEGK